MSAALPAEVRLRDVTLRDGLQDEKPIPTDDKLALFEALVGAGVDDLELTSFVRPDRVPALADASELAARTDGSDGVTRWALVLNERGAQRAIEAGLDHLQFVVSVADAHSVANAGCTTAKAMERLSSLAASLDPGVTMEVTLATAFGCPYSGAVEPSRVHEAVERALALGADGVSLADTIGTATPSEVGGLVGAVGRQVSRSVPIGVHLHDTRGLALVNALAALEAGCSRIDGAVGGLGGCPFAPGASGNLALEDLVHLLEAESVRTGVDLDRLIVAAELACTLVARPIGSSVGRAGPRFSSRKTDAT